MSYYVCILIDSWGSVLGMVTGLCAGFPRNCGSFPERVKSTSVLQCASLLQSFKITFRAHPVSYSMGTGWSCLGGRASGYEADHSPHLMLIRMSAAVKAVPLLHAQGHLHLDTFTKSVAVMIEWFLVDCCVPINIDCGSSWWCHK